MTTLNSPLGAIEEVEAFMTLESLTRNQPYEFLVEYMLCRSTFQSPSTELRDGSSLDLHKNLTKMIQEKSLFGLEEPVPMIIDALKAHVFILSEAGGFKHVDHMKVRATRIAVSDVEDHSYLKNSG